MTTSPTDAPSATPTEEFRRDLESLVLRSFSQGGEVAGTHEITTACSAVPDWRITVEKLDDGAVPDDGVFVDE